MIRICIITIFIMIRITMKRIIQHNIKAAKLAWLETYTDRSRTLLQWEGDSLDRATALSIRHDFQIDQPAPVGELLLPRKVGRAAHIPDQHASNAQLNDGAFVRGFEVDVMQTAKGVQYGRDARGAVEELMERGAAD